MIADDQRAPRVFISYADDSEEHEQQVLNFARFLRSEGGIDVRFNQWETVPRRDWSVWVITQLDEVDFVLVIASPAYKRRAEGSTAESDRGRTQFETALLRDKLTGNRDKWIPKMLPVVLPGRSDEEIPTFLQPNSTGHYIVDSFTLKGADDLFRVITGQPRDLAPTLGQLVIRPPLTEHSAAVKVAVAVQLWKQGQEVTINTKNYVIAKLESEVVAPDLSWVRRQAIARRSSAPTHLVVLRQVSVVHYGESAEAQQAALVAEATLLADMASVAGFPRLLDQMSDQDSVTVVLSKSPAHNLRDLYSSPFNAPGSRRRLEQKRVVGFLRVVQQLCRTLQMLHQRELSHRALTLDAVLLLDDEQIPTLRDIGLATTTPTPGEGIPPYQAPEQRHPSGYPFAPGVRTDVYQLALIVGEILTGDIRPGNSPPTYADDPHIPQPLTRLLNDALSPTTTDRPQNAAAFNKRLAKVIDEIQL